MQRHIVIGDIHGCFVELQRLLVEVHANHDDVVVSVGDVVDRGPESADVVRYFRENPQHHVLVGNHERKHVRGIFSYAQEITRLQLGAGYPDAVEWMRSLPFFIELDCAIIVHAAALPDRPLSTQDPEILCGTTSGEKALDRILDGTRWHERWNGPKPVIFGHHVVDEPLIRPGLIYGIDTGACHGGHLTALTLPDFRVYAVPAREDHWARVKRMWQADVLATKPWTSMPWSELDEQLARFRTATEPRAKGYVDTLHAWRAAVDARIEAVVDAVGVEAARVEPEAMKSHPLSRYLFQASRGRLDRPSLLRQIHHACDLDALAVAVGLPPLPPPSPPQSGAS